MRGVVADEATCGGDVRSPRARRTDAGSRTAAAIGLWNAVYLERVVAALLAWGGEEVPEEYLAHLSLLEREHVTLIGVYRWDLDGSPASRPGVPNGFTSRSANRGNREASPNRWTITRVALQSGRAPNTQGAPSRVARFSPPFRLRLAASRPPGKDDPPRRTSGFPLLEFPGHESRTGSGLFEPEHLAPTREEHRPG